jgi:hypothetical protein
MKYKQILKKISNDQLVDAIERDLNCLLERAFIKNDFSLVLAKLLSRWDCVLKEEQNISVHYKHKIWLCISILMHKNGLVDNRLTQKAHQAIDALNNDTVLGDSFFKQSEKIKQALLLPPESLKRKPSRIKDLTF